MHRNCGEVGTVLAVGIGGCYHGLIRREEGKYEEDAKFMADDVMIM